MVAAWPSSSNGPLALDVHAQANERRWFRRPLVRRPFAPALLQSEFSDDVQLRTYADAARSVSPLTVVAALFSLFSSSSASLLSRPATSAVNPIFSASSSVDDGGGNRATTCRGSSDVPQKSGTRAFTFTKVVRADQHSCDSWQVTARDVTATSRTSLRSCENFEESTT